VRNIVASRHLMCAVHQAIKTSRARDTKISAKSRPNFDATPHKATFIVVALPPAQVPCSLSRAQGSESRTHAQYIAMPEILPLSCLPHFSLVDLAASIFNSKTGRYFQ